MPAAAIEDLPAPARNLLELASHDPPIEVVAIGASAGGVEALTTVVGQLPANFRAAVLVVLHVTESGRSVLPSILDRSSPLPASYAHDGERIERGHIYVSPPGSHLTVGGGVTHLDQRPRENGHRPAADPLFRAVARSYGARAAGVVLSGARDDGTAGLHEIKLHGGVTIVQDPEQALYAGMPCSAMLHTRVDAVLRLQDIGFALARLAGEEPGPATRIPVAAADKASPPLPDPIGADTRNSRFVCPDCGGALFEFRYGSIDRFACSVGHAYSFESLFEEQAHHLESALWGAIRSLDDRAELLWRMERHCRKTGAYRAAQAFEQRAREAAERAETIRAALERVSAGWRSEVEQDAEPREADAGDADTNGAGGNAPASGPTAQGERT